MLAIFTDPNTGPPLMIGVLVLVTKMLVLGRVELAFFGEKVSQSAVDLTSISLSFAIMAGLGGKFSTQGTAISAILFWIVLLLVVQAVITHTAVTAVTWWGKTLKTVVVAGAFLVPLSGISYFSEMLITKAPPNAAEASGDRH